MPYAVNNSHETIHVKGCHLQTSKQTIRTDPYLMRPLFWAQSVSKRSISNLWGVHSIQGRSWD